MKKTYPYTFSHWMRGACGDVVDIPKEEYVSRGGDDYLRVYSYLRDRGWKKEGNRWVHEESGRSTTDINVAINSQKYRDSLNER